ncbi:DUF1330 domain-containing protein [Streptomyces griseobrunneus]|uniref:DUF1330 domain-containing protein n=1 Tax=Streptomyces rhizosphaericola TaxID=2564098 RepID=A0ABY2P6C5_9ACTN|nr:MULTISPECIES: DUF1330 domain-containing protein [Streptomyces]ARI56408.1 hypothetical protein A6E92_10655 [Streptomyces sp. S8]TGY99533.1 DUF1330 domain-containing protein [Streptomyces rhizosphaericola]
MTAYAIAHLRPADGPVHDEVLSYIERIQATMEPYGGRFLVHGAEVEVVEGEWPGALVLVAFPGVEEIRAWYASPAYQEILPLRTRHFDGDVVIVPGVGPEYDAPATAAAMRAARDRSAAVGREEAGKGPEGA